MNSKYQILLTNDDGIDSPGLWAAAESLSSIGFVHVIAPREQHSGSGRSMPSISDGKIQIHSQNIQGKIWSVYGVGGSPAQTVQHALLEILPATPDLIVSGINFGENIGVNITASGTVGAAIEGGMFGVPGLAISLETHSDYYFSKTTSIDFSGAAYFAKYFAEIMLKKKMPQDVNILKVDVPAEATSQTKWKITRLSTVPYYKLIPPDRRDWNETARIGFKRADNIDHPMGSDSHALLTEKIVSVTPISLDMTSRTNFSDLEEILRS